jgi:shikimate kinase
VNATRTIHNLALVGFMGSGKSSVGQMVAAQLRFRFLDTDAVIEDRAGKSISAIFAEDGEAAFRALEQGVVAELARGTKTVIATGGGLVVQPGNLDSLKRHALVICLWASADSLWQRVRHQAHRPLLQTPDPPGRIRQLLAEREPFYRQADVLVNTEMRSLKDVVHQVIHQFRMAHRHPAIP